MNHEPDAELLETFTTFFTKESPVARMRATDNAGDQIAGFDAELWEQTRALGVPGLAVEGATLLDLVAIVECAGKQLAPIPLVETLVSLRLLNSFTDKSKSILAEVISGEVIATIALTPAVGGIAHLVPSGAIGEAVLALDDDELVMTRPEPSCEPISTIAPAATANVPLTGQRTVLAEGKIATAAYAAALIEWRILRTAALVGLSQGVLELGIKYAQTREQFGVPIGSFQAVQHRLADGATTHEGARLLVRAAAIETDPQRKAVLARMAFWFAGKSARTLAGTVLHVHGGYGFMLEYDPQLFFRFATAWSIELGDPDAELEDLANELDEKDWKVSDSQSSPFGAEVKKFLAKHCPPALVENAHRSGTMHDWDLHRALAHEGLLAADWPPEMGGQGRDPWEMFELNEELARVGAPIDGWGISNLVAHTLTRVGTEEQKRTIIPKILAGEILCCLGYSEPDAGSDVAAANTFAQRDGDDWIINGQKVFTTLAQESDYVFLLTRTNRDATKHRSLTMFLVPTDTPGVEVTPIETLGGERTNMTFYSDVRIPDGARVGEVDGGWDVMGVALAYERNPAMVGELGRLCTRFASWAKESGVITRSSVRSRLTKAIVDYQVGRLLGIQLTAAIARGELPYVEGSMAKLFASEALVRAAADFVDAAGASGQISLGDPLAPANGWLEHAHRHAQVTTIYAGTSEIQRSIIAERGLGLPRSRGAK